MPIGFTHEYVVFSGIGGKIVMIEHDLLPAKTLRELACAIRDGADYGVETRRYEILFLGGDMSVSYGDNVVYLSPTTVDAVAITRHIEREEFLAAHACVLFFRGVAWHRHDILYDLFRGYNIMFDFIVANGVKIIAVLATIVIVMMVVVLARIEKYGSGARVVTLHYTSWCGHCARMKPVWEQVRAACKGNGIVFVESDEEKNKTPGIDSYPTIVMVNEYGVREQYQMGPDFNQLHKWIVAVRNPVVF